MNAIDRSCGFVVVFTTVLSYSALRNQVLATEGRRQDARVMALLFTALLGWNWILSPKEKLNLIGILSLFLSYLDCQAHNQMEQYAEIIGRLIRS